MDYKFSGTLISTSILKFMSDKEAKRRDEAGNAKSDFET